MVWLHYLQSVKAHAAIRRVRSQPKRISRVEKDLIVAIGGYRLAHVQPAARLSKGAIPVLQLGENTVVCVPVNRNFPGFQELDPFHSKVLYGDRYLEAIGEVAVGEVRELPVAPTIWRKETPPEITVSAAGFPRP
jgi:hypothetical protein